MRRIEPGTELRSLVLIAALAAIEVSARLGRYLPVSVGTRHWRGAAHTAMHQGAHWTHFEHDRLSRVPVAEALGMLDAARAAEAPRRALQVDLIDRPVELNAGQAAVRILFRLGEDMLSVIAVCAEDDPWAQACDAVAELYAEILHELLTDPAATPGQARGLGSASRQMVLGWLAGEARDYGPWRAIPHMIEENAERHPERPAYRFEGRSLSYREFDGLANAFAAKLSSRGVAKGAIVPVLLANSLEMPVAYHALMKLGAAFVPLDRAWPAERLVQAIETLASDVVVCANAGDLPDAFRHCALPLDIGALAPLPLSLPLRPGVEIGPDDAIYGIFTSGTTGRAKCALNLHGGLANRFRFMSRYFDRNAGERRILQNSRHTFDSSVWQLFWPLTSGAEVVIPRQDAFLDLEATVETIARHRITMTDFVPSVFNEVVALAERDPRAAAKLATLTELIVGGEEITPPMVHKLRALLPQLRITNAYGPTETSIGMVFHPVEAADGMSIPIGRPIDNCYVVVVDDELRPLPPGACGELLIGGICVGAGYVKQPEVTARAFVGNPFPAIPGALLYRTGDLGYFDSRGKLRFVGRKDFQVKVGGVRIELGEVEAAAERCPQVRHAKALVATHRGAKSIALFVTGEPDLDRTALERHLRGFLPRASLPRHYFVLVSMPLSENGKVDRKQLQAQLDAHLAEQERTAPSSGEGVTGRVLAVFRSLIARPDLAADDDFFEAGGDSLQALAATAELERLFPVRFSVHDLLAHASAARAGARIEHLLAGGETGESEEETLERDARYAGTARAELFGTAHGHLRSLPAASHEAAAPASVLLTGGTGFVGSYLAKALLERRDDLQVFVLTRAEGDAQHALVDLFKRKRLWDDRYAGRLHAVKGDLATPGLGLDAAGRDALAARCDAILHCGALVNFVYDYRAHRASNVLATQELLRLSLTGRMKPLFFISTLGALEAQALRHTALLDEAFDPEFAERPKSGYSRSKWAAERMLLEARREGAPVTIFRLGEVMPSAAEGIPNARALTHFLLTAFALLKARPAVAMYSDWSPVDYVANRVVSAIFDPAAWNGAYHVFHAQSVSFAGALEHAGHALDTLTCTQWLAALEARIAQGGPRELGYLRRLLPRADSGEAALAEAFSNALTNNPSLFSRSACEALERTHGLAEADLSEAIAAYGRHLAQFC
ncbi:non-ribosomal peptide synthetase [Trinickia terrae]|nr:non-ribosomal peptide synthetase [Trinickia terrae]